MKEFNLKEMVKGWFIGDFDPSILKSKEFEVAVKRYSAGEFEKNHFHKLAQEVTVIVTGTVRMCGKEFGEGSIIVLDREEPTSFEALTDAITVVVKTPSVSSDKYEC